MEDFTHDGLLHGYLCNMKCNMKHNFRFELCIQY